MTGDVAFEDQKERVGQGHLICIILGGEKRVHKILDSFSQTFVFIASLKSSPVLQPSQSQGGRAPQGPAAPRHLGARGGVDRALDTLASEGHSVLGGRCATSKRQVRASQ